MAADFKTGSDRPADRLVSLYDRGVLTATETVIELSKLSCEHSPDSFVDRIPPEVLEQLRDCAESPPEMGTDCIVIHRSVCVAESVDAAAWEKARIAESRQYIQGLWDWHRYFAERNGNTQS